LRSYKKPDDSYDIYWLHYDDFDGEVYQVGRDFFDFIHDFCLGRKSYSFLPESMQPEPCESLWSEMFNADLRLKFN